MANDLSNIIGTYKKYVIENPLIVNQLEVLLTSVSYLTAGQYARSTFVTELIHSVSNLLNLVNDCILRKAANISVHDDATVGKLQTFLATIEYSEVLIEVAALRHNEKTRWLVVFGLQIIKAVIRFILILKYKQGLQCSPPIPPLNRRRDLPKCNVKPGSENGMLSGLSFPSEKADVTFTLKRSGRVIRTLDTAPPLVSRNWKLPNHENVSRKVLDSASSELTNGSLAGELLHITRPLVHLASMRKYGKYSWRPWLIALGMDLASLHIIRQSRTVSRAEKIEVFRRALSLLLFLLRSPFYDQFSKLQIIYTLKMIGDSIPGFGFLFYSLMGYILEWQQIYSYVWSL